MLFLLITILLFLISSILLPFPNWKSFYIVFMATLSSDDIGLQQRASMLIYLLKELVFLPVWAFFWLIDELFFAQYHNCKIEGPVFIFSQPRSGTTFLLRTLAEDEDMFFSVKHLEWRYPYISFWKLLDLLNLRSWLEKKSYWPNNKLGRLCNKIHFHVLGNHEEFGIFLEERFYHHYFVFRRFPFDPVMQRISNFETLTKKEKEIMINTFVRVVRKVSYHRGGNQKFVTKENESVEFCRALIEKFADAKVLFIVREPGKILDSYNQMSVTCTTVKHGVDPRKINSWHERNIEFRKSEFEKYVAFVNDLCDRGVAVIIPFQKFTTEVLETTRKIYEYLGLPIGVQFHETLKKLQRDQDQRQKGYVNPPCQEKGFDFFEKFVKQVNQERGI